MTAGFFAVAPAAKKEAAGDAPPVLLSTKGNPPKWTTLPQLQQFAAKGDPQACFELGVRYLEGDEVGQDTSRAITLFETAAKHLIHEHTGGIPRAINNLATTCLIHAASQQLKRIHEALVVEAASELRLL